MMTIQYGCLFSTMLWAVAIITTSMLFLTQCCCQKKKKGPRAPPPKAMQPPKKGAGAKGKAVKGPVAGGKPKNLPTKPRMDEPKFGPIKEADGLMSYEDANKQLRRKPLPTPQPPAPRTPPRPSPAPVIVEFPAGGAAGPKMVEQRPKENEGVVVNSPDYDTLKIVREMDVFGTGDKDKQREDDKPIETPEPENEKNDNSDGAEDEGIQPGMAGQGDYETLAEIGDVFATGK